MSNTTDQYINAINKEKEKRRNIRRYERNITGKMNLLGSMPLINRTNNFEENLKAVLPKHMVPSNVGSYKEIMWPYWFVFDVDYSNGDNTFIPAGEVTPVHNQVSNEAAFIAIELYRSYNSIGDAGRGATLQVTLRDRQSSRQLNDEPIQLQHLGERGQGISFPTPYIFMPNARLTLEFSSWLSADQTIIGESGKHSIILFGYRIRTEDAQLIADKIFL